LTREELDFVAKIGYYVQTRETVASPNFISIEVTLWYLDHETIDDAAPNVCEVVHAKLAAYTLQRRPA
jgi:hypothetical protein